MRNGVSRYPLFWPLETRRTNARQTPHLAILLGITKFNRQAPPSPGVARWLWPHIRLALGSSPPDEMRSVRTTPGFQDGGRTSGSPHTPLWGIGSESLSQVAPMTVKTDSDWPYVAWAVITLCARSPAKADLLAKAGSRYTTRLG